MNMEPAAWQQSLLENLGAGGAGLNAPLKRSGSMFDWRLVAAVRILCAEKERELRFKKFQQLGDLDKPQAAGIDVRLCTHIFHNGPAMALLCYPQLHAHPSAKQDIDMRTEVVEYM